MEIASFAKFVYHSRANDDVVYQFRFVILGALMAEKFSKLAEDC